MNADPRRDYLKAYAVAYEQLSPENLGVLGKLLNDNVNFVDPFNDLIGREQTLAVFTHMFKTVSEPRFQVYDVAIGDTACYLRWEMTGRTRGRNTELSLHGMSEVHFDGNGQVLKHIDHWDSLSQLFAKLPAVGGIARFVLRKLSAKIDVSSSA